MSKYIIVDKDRGNKLNKKCQIRYQVLKDNNLYRTELFCTKLDGRIIYCWVDGIKTPMIDTIQDKVEFMEELKVFQKGGAYHKTHLINT